MFSQKEIEFRTIDLAKQISTDYQYKNTLVISILKGSFMFFSDLVKHISIPIFIEFIQASSYYNSKVSSGSVRFNLPNIDYSQYHILLIEDIVDTGNTLNKIAGALQDKNPLSIKVCSLLFKRDKYQAKLPIDYYGFLVDDHFVVGYGMDLAEKYRHLNYIGVFHG